MKNFLGTFTGNFAMKLFHSALLFLVISATFKCVVEASAAENQQQESVYKANSFVQFKDFLKEFEKKRGTERFKVLFFSSANASQLLHFLGLAMKDESIVAYQDELSESSTFQSDSPSKSFSIATSEQIAGASKGKTSETPSMNIQLISQVDAIEITVDPVVERLFFEIANSISKTNIASSLKVLFLEFPKVSQTHIGSEISVQFPESIFTECYLSKKAVFSRYESKMKESDTFEHEPKIINHLLMTLFIKKIDEVFDNLSISGNLENSSQDSNQPLNIQSDYKLSLKGRESVNAFFLFFSIQSKCIEKDKNFQNAAIFGLKNLKHLHLEYIFDDFQCKRISHIQMLKLLETFEFEGSVEKVDEILKELRKMKEMKEIPILKSVKEITAKCSYGETIVKFKIERNSQTEDFNENDFELETLIERRLQEIKNQISKIEQSQESNELSEMKDRVNVLKNMLFYKYAIDTFDSILKSNSYFDDQEKRAFADEIKNSIYLRFSELPLDNYRDFIRIIEDLSNEVTGTSDSSLEKKAVFEKLAQKLDEKYLGNALNFM